MPAAGTAPAALAARPGRRAKEHNWDLEQAQGEVGQLTKAVKCQAIVDVVSRRWIDTLVSIEERDMPSGLIVEWLRRRRREHPSKNVPRTQGVPPWKDPTASTPVALGLPNGYRSLRSRLGGGRGMGGEAGRQLWQPVHDNVPNSVVVHAEVLVRENVAEPLRLLDGQLDVQSDEPLRQAARCFADDLQLPLHRALQYPALLVLGPAQRCDLGELAARVEDVVDALLVASCHSGMASSNMARWLSLTAEESTTSTEWPSRSSRST